jgi:putative nucleotide binding protein
MNEENAIILDFLPQGKSSSFKSEPVGIAIGTSFFTLLELVPKSGVELKPMEKVYIGKDVREKIDHIKQRITFDDLTTSSQNELEKAIDQIIRENEKKFVQFFNKAGPISLKRHQLELLPSIGKNHLEELIQARTQKPFESLQEIDDRVKFISNPLNIIRRRVLGELEGKDKFYLFVRPPQSEDKQRRHRYR